MTLGNEELGDKRKKKNFRPREEWESEKSDFRGVKCLFIERDEASARSFINFPSTLCQIKSGSVRNFF